MESAAVERFKVEVFHDPAAALDAWAGLEQVACASIYQTRRFVIPWFDTMGRAAGIVPMITLVRDRDGVPVALFPFGMRQSNGLRIGEFLGGKDSNANIGLFRPGIDLDAASIDWILRQAAERSGLNLDGYILSNQPAAWEGFDNPLAALPHQDSPSFCYSAELEFDSEAFQKRQLSGDARKKLRTKRRKLEEMGPVSLLTARTEAEAQMLLDAFFAQKLQRFDEKNIKSGFDSPAARSFFARCCISRIGRRDASLELHGLMVGEKVVATYGGGVHRNRFHGMINSFDQSPEFARCSPGDILLSMLIESKCRQELAVFDLGIGEGRYKQSWCDRTEPLFDTLLPLTLKGHAFALAEAGRRQIKRTIKQTPWAWSLATKIRSGLRRPA